MVIVGPIDRVREAKNTEGDRELEAVGNPLLKNHQQNRIDLLAEDTSLERDVRKYIDYRTAIPAALSGDS